MLDLKRNAGLLSLLVVILAGAADDSKPADELTRLKAELEVASTTLRERLTGATDAEKKAAGESYRQQAAVFARRALALATLYPDAPEAPELLGWVRGVGGYSVKLDAECDEAYDLLAKRYLDNDAILPVIRIAWTDAYATSHAESFLRRAMEQSTNHKVKALACFTLGRHQQQVVRLSAYLNDPSRGAGFERDLGPENSRRIRAIDVGAARREAVALYERTLKEFADLQPMGKDFPPLGEQAEGALYRIRNLEIGCTVPEIEGEDIQGKPLKLSDVRGKVVVISFWATWCGPCMEMVPGEKALVEKMKGRPFVLVGVNGDEDRAKAKEVSIKEGITWRSFWDVAPHGPISSRWGISAWPTIYLIDANGVIRNENLRGESLDRAVEALVKEHETGSK